MAEEEKKEEPEKSDEEKKAEKEAEKAEKRAARKARREARAKARKARAMARQKRWNEPQTEDGTIMFVVRVLLWMIGLTYVILVAMFFSKYK